MTSNFDDIAAQLLNEIDTALDAAADATPAHALCPLCYPAPQPGQLITAVCGTKKTFGHYRAATSGCPACDHLADTTTLPCGHPGERPTR